MEIEKIGEILRIYTEKYKYNSGFLLHKKNYVNNEYVNVNIDEVTFYGYVFDDYHKRSYTSMISINLKDRTIYNISCDCEYAFNERGSKVCSHIVAVVLKGIENLKNKNKEELNKGDIVLNPLVTLNISQSRNKNLGCKLYIEGIDESEYSSVFNSYKDNYKYHLRKDGSYIDLKDNNLQKVFQLIDILGIYENLNNIRIPENKSIFLDKFIEENDLNFIEGTKYIKNVIKKYKNANEEFSIPINIKSILRDYQVKGVEFLAELSQYKFGGIICDEMGLGKTIQTLAFLQCQSDKKSIVITPTSLIYNWKSEFEKFAPNINLGIAYGSKNTRLKVLENVEKYDVILTSYGTYKNDIEIYKQLKFDYCIIDEAQYIKNPNSLITKAIKGIKANVKFALTGTPIENNLLELWSIFDFVMPGYLYNENKFKRVFLNNERNLIELKKLIKPFMIRRTKAEVIEELPDKIEYKFIVELEKEHKRAYNSFVNLAKRRILENNENNISVLSYLTKLRQLSIAPEMVVKNYKGKNSKLEILMNIINDNSNKKILIFSQFTKVLNIIGNRLNSENISYSYIDGKTEAKKRLDLVEEFNTTNKYKIFLISLKAGGIGLNLTSASMVIHYDPWWNPAVENQATDRAHRIGQKSVVDVIKLISKDTVEQNIICMQEQKKELITDIINLNLQNSVKLNELSMQELISLFDNN